VDWKEQLALAESPYGLAVVPEHEIVEYTDLRHEEVRLARWRPVLDRLGIEILGVRDVPSTPTRLTVDGIDWDLVPMGDGVYSVPPSVYYVIRAAEAAGVPFGHWLWGEERFARPSFQQNPGRTVRSGRSNAGLLSAVGRALRDPIVIGVIPTAPGRGMWCLLGRWFH
jgi:hypothetical protein